MCLDTHKSKRKLGHVNGAFECQNSLAHSWEIKKIKEDVWKASPKKLQKLHPQRLASAEIQIIEKRVTRPLIIFN